MRRSVPLRAVIQVWPGFNGSGFPEASLNSSGVFVSSLLQVPVVTVPSWNTNAWPLPVTPYCECLSLAVPKLVMMATPLVMMVVQVCARLRW